MSRIVLLGKISEATQDTASSVKAAAQLVSIPDQTEFFMVYALLTGLTGGVLDVYLQTELEKDVWADWLRFPQVAGSAAAQMYSAPGNAGSGLITAVGGGTDATPAPGFASTTGSALGGFPCHNLRAVWKTGTGVSAGATQKIWIFGRRE